MGANFKVIVTADPLARRGSGGIRVMNKCLGIMLLRFRMASPRLLTSLFRASMPESPVNAVCGVQLRYKPLTGARWKYTSVTMTPAQELLIGPAQVCER